MWLLSDLNADKVYCLGLCQDLDGTRFFQLAPLHERECYVNDPRVFNWTRTVPMELLRKRNLSAIAQEVSLESGQKFFVDAHGVWLTEKEFEQLKQGIGFEEVKWSTGTGPQNPMR